MWASLVTVLGSAVMACRLYSVGLRSHLFESEVLKEVVLASPSLCRRVGAKYRLLPSYRDWEMPVLSLLILHIQRDGSQGPHSRGCRP